MQFLFIRIQNLCSLHTGQDTYYPVYYKPSVVMAMPKNQIYVHKQAIVKVLSA